MQPPPRVPDPSTQSSTKHEIPFQTSAANALVLRSVCDRRGVDVASVAALMRREWKERGPLIRDVWVWKRKVDMPLQ